MGENETSTTTDGVQIAGYASRDELMSVRVVAASKRIFVALCENDRGRFIKLSDGRGKIIVPAEGIPQMRDALVALETALESHPPPALQTTHAEEVHDEHASHANHASAHAGAGHDESKSELIEAQRFLSEGRKFYFDILENARGRYLKISQSSTRRVTMIMPINGLTLLREGVDMLLDKAPPDTTVTDPSAVHRISRTVEKVTPTQDGASVIVNVVQREIRVLGKRVVFESGANRRGSYIKIMENSGSQRMTVMLPHSAVPEMIELLQEVVEAGDPADALNNARATQS